MPLLYGEADRAFLRLQEEINRRIDDDSILAWGLEPEMDHPLGLVSDNVKADMAEASIAADLLESSPKDFIHCANLRYTPRPTSPFALTNVGLQIQLPLVPVDQPDDDINSQSGDRWIRLLSCSSGTSQTYLGIPLVSAIDDDGPTVRKMTRIVISTKAATAVTLAVGPRAAVRSFLGAILISRYGTDSFAGEDYVGHEQVIVNESRNLHELGYRVKNVTRLNITLRKVRVNGQGLIWDPKTLVLTMESYLRHGKLIEFCFESPRIGQNSTFSISIHTVTSGIMVRKGATFSKADKRGFYDYLQNQTTEDDTDNIMIPGGEGIMFKVSARIHKTKVYSHRISEVIVEAIQVVNSTVWYWIRALP